MSDELRDLLIDVLRLPILANDPEWRTKIETILLDEKEIKF